MKELLFGLFAFEELDVVDQEHVGMAVFVAKFERLIVLDRDDELVGELLRGHVHDAGARILVQHAVPDRMHQMGLAQTDPAVEKQRVVGAGRGFGDRQRRGMREAVGIAYDELIEGVAPGSARRRASR